MTGGLKHTQWITDGRTHSCETCGASLAGKRSNARTCSDKCRKIKNGQTKRGDS